MANRFLLVSPDYPPPLVGGSLVWLLNLVQNCPENIDILTGSIKSGEKEVTDPRHTVYRSRFIIDSHEPPRLKLFISYLSMLFWVTRKHLRSPYKAVVVNPGVVGNSLFFLWGKLFGVTVVGAGHGEEITMALYGRGLKPWIKRTLMKFAYPKASGFFVVCHFCRDLLVSMGVKEETIDVIPSCINPQKILPYETQKEKKHRVLSVGRLIERKGFHCLVDAVNLLKEELPDIRLTIVGDGPWKPILLEKSKELGIKDRVSIKGLLSDRELATLYQESDLFVLAHMMLPNGDTEGCPTVFSEAMANGLPVIGGTGAGADTAIIEGENGFIVDARNRKELADRIKTILTNSALAESMKRVGIEKLRRDHDPVAAGHAFFKTVMRLVDGVPVEGNQARMNLRQADKKKTKELNYAVE